ncbi:MAG: hypothetical protein Q7K57_12190 [Burkholderiaceae bacterium]|nr:hypothetical protein [Burkholderiaceae bacterium]
MKIRAHEEADVARLSQGILDCQNSGISLPGIQTIDSREVFLNQMIDSVRRIKYVSTLAIPRRDISQHRADGNSLLFDPLKAAIWHLRQGNIDEASWLAFLFVHFGKHKKSGWRYAREVYGALGAAQGWTWERVSAAPKAFRAWLEDNEHTLKRGVNRGFGNHRKYVSMSATKASGTGAAIETYTQWVMAAGSHTALFTNAEMQAKGAPEIAFDRLYKSMKVRSFARMGKFDYLTMIGKLGIANIRPGNAYMKGATGPVAGARLMFHVQGTPQLSITQLSQRMIDMGRYLGVGMQEMEDAICNWQKSPVKYEYFGG